MAKVQFLLLELQVELYNLFLGVQYRLTVVLFNRELGKSTDLGFIYTIPKAKSKAIFFFDLCRCLM